MSEDTEARGDRVAAYDQASALCFDAPKVVSSLRPLDLVKTLGEEASTYRHPGQDFWRRGKWSPDGTHLLAQSDSHVIDLFYVKQGSTSTAKLNTAEDKHNVSLVHVFSIRAPSTLLALEWYPFAQYAEPATWCFAFSARDVPTRLVDAYTGKTRATYAILDHTERFVGPLALAFGLDGTRLYCGHDSNVTIFSLTRPGVNTYLCSMSLSPSRKVANRTGLGSGQRGTISCLAAAPDHFAGSGHEVLVVGTFSGSIGLYKMSFDEVGEGERKSADHAQSLCLAGWREVNAAGITQIAFHPTGPHILFLTSRRSNEIRAYDLQYIGSRKSFLNAAPDVALIGVFDREIAKATKQGTAEPAEAQTGDKCDTQQRIFFALDWSGLFLFSGSAAGHVRVWDIALPGRATDKYARKTEEKMAHTEHSVDFFGSIRRSDKQSALRPPLADWHGANDAVSSVALHPHIPLLSLTCGARHWSSQLRSAFAQSNTSGSGDESDSGSDSMELDSHTHYIHTRDASIRLFCLA